MTEVIEVDTHRIVAVDASRAVEIDKGESRVIEVTSSLKYSSNKMTFVVGTTNGTPISAGDKHTYGTRFGDGSIYRWVIISDVTTDLSVKIQRSSSFPTFSDLATINLVADSYATGAVSIPIADLDILNLVVLSNTLSQRLSVELFIR